MAHVAALTVPVPQVDYPQLLTFYEFRSPDEALGEDSRRILSDWLSRQEPRPSDEVQRVDTEVPATLGLKFEPSGRICALHFVGQVWAKPGELAIVIRPKQGHGLSLATSMLRRSLADPHAAAHLGEMFWFWPDEEPIT